jgi:hypothetical protein
MNSLKFHRLLSKVLKLVLLILRVLSLSFELIRKLF